MTFYKLIRSTISNRRSPSSPPPPPPTAATAAVVHYSHSLPAVIISHYIEHMRVLKIRVNYISNYFASLSIKRAALLSKIHLPEQFPTRIN